MLSIAPSILGLLACQHINLEIGKPEGWPTSTPLNFGCRSNGAVNSFMNDVAQEIFDKWDLPRRSRGTSSVRIGFVLGADGEIVRSAIFEAIDRRLARSALRALRDSAPFPPLIGPKSCLIEKSIVGTFWTHPEAEELARQEEAEEPLPEEAAGPRPEEIGEAVLIRIDGSASPLPNGSPAATLESGTEAKPIRRQNPVYPIDEAEREVEGWVEIGFTIKGDGTVGDPVIKDSIGGEPFELAALESLEAWEYEPATMNGEAFERCHARVALAFEMFDEGGRRHLASEEFWNAYHEAFELLDEERFAEASVIVDELATKNDRNLHENAMAWLLRAVVQESTGDSEGQLKSLKRAASPNGDHLESPIYAETLLLIATLQVGNELYGDAFETFEKLEKLAPDFPEWTARTSAFAEEMGQIGTLLRALKSAEQPLVTVGAIGEDAHHPGEELWRHTLLRKTAGIDELEGHLDHFEIRCERRRVKAGIEQGVAVQIPVGWGQCEIYVFGDRGSTFRLVQYPNFAAESKSMSRVEARAGDR